MQANIIFMLVSLRGGVRVARNTARALQNRLSTHTAASRAAIGIARSEPHAAAARGGSARRVAGFTDRVDASAIRLKPRRHSMLRIRVSRAGIALATLVLATVARAAHQQVPVIRVHAETDRKSTRLNSSHRT